MRSMRYQPQGRARIARGGIASGMVVSLQGGAGLRDVIRGIPATSRGANQAVRATPGGLAFDCRGVATGAYFSAASEAAALAGDQSLVFDLSVAGAPAGNVPAIGGLWRSTIQDDAFLIVERSSADAIQVRVRLGGTLAVRTFNIGASALYGRRITVAISVSRVSGQAIALCVAAEGVVLFEQSGSYSVSGSPVVTPTGDEYISIGSEQIENPSRNPNCVIYAQHHLARVISADEVASLSRAPWQVYQAAEEYPDEIAAAAIALEGAWAEGNEINSAAASARVSATATWVEAVESNQAALRASVNAASTWIEANEQMVIGATIGTAVTASATWAEADEQTAILGTIGNAIAASVNWTESNETVAVAGRVDVLANAAWAELLETSAAQITVGAAVTANASWAEQGEVNTAAARLDIRLLAAWAEGGDTFALRAYSGDEQEDIDALLVPPRQTVVFEGSRRVVAFEGGKRVVSFEGSKRMVEFP